MVELIGDLGAGKTTFVRGLARGAGSTDHVASPTFTISRVYEADRSLQKDGMQNPNDPPLAIHHFDFYRLHEPGIIADELAEVVHDRHIVTVVEWADVVQHVLPAKRLTVQIEQSSPDTRRFTFRAPEALGYLLQAMNSRETS